MDVDKSSGLITFGGLQSKLDTNAIVNAMVEAAAIPMRKIEQAQEVLDVHSEIYSTISSAMSDFSLQANKMLTATKFLQQRATSSDDNIVQATAGDGARSGTYKVQVTALATAQRTLSSQVDARGTAGLLQAGRIDWQVDGTSFGVDVDATTTLDSLSQAINNTGGGISSSVLFDGSKYRLLLSGTQPGARYATSFTDGSNLGLDAPASVLQPAQDAAFIIDRTLSMTRPSNTINDAIDGVTLSLQDTGPVQSVHVGSDAAGIFNKVEAFVDGYNTVVAAIDVATKPGTDLEKGRLVGDTTLRTLRQNMQRIVTSSVTGVNPSFCALSQVGVSSDKEGHLVLDKMKLGNVISTNANELAQVFVRSYTPSSVGVASKIQTLADQYTLPLTGILPQKVASITKQRNGSDARLAQMQVNLDRYEQTVRKQFNDMETNMTKMKSQNDYLQQQMKSMQAR